MTSNTILGSDLAFISAAARNEILEQTLVQIKTGEKMPHSYQSIVEQDRQFGVGVRMSATDRLFDQHTLVNGALTPSGKLVSYSGQDIAEIFINSVRQHGTSYYPVSGDFSNVQGLKYLYIFVKNLSEKKYLPIARFSISSILKQDKLNGQQLQTLTDVTPIAYCTFKTVFEITNVQTVDLPDDFLGNSSATSVYSRAFRGQNPVVFLY